MSPTLAIIPFAILGGMVLHPPHSTAFCNPWMLGCLLHFRLTITVKAVGDYIQEPIWASTAIFPFPFVEGSYFVRRLAPWPTADPPHKESPRHPKNAEFYVPFNPCPVLSQLAQPAVVNRAQTEPGLHKRSVTVWKNLLLKVSLMSSVG